MGGAFGRKRVANLLLGIAVLFCWGGLRSKAQSVPGDAISIDCGITTNYKDALGISWSTDSNYVSTGQNAVVGTTAANLGVDRLQNVQKLGTLRYFPEVRKKYCYVIPEVASSSMYLIRVMFLGANFTASQGQNVSFGITINNYYWADVTISDSYTPLVKESTFVTGSNSFSLCLVQGVGTPFISSLELRLLPNSSYQTTQNPSRALHSVFRWNCGTASSTPTVRFPDDPYDRLWAPDPPSIRLPSLSNSSATIDNSGNNPPITVLQSAWTASPRNSLSFSWPIETDTSLLIYFLYFAEIASVSEYSKRELVGYVDGQLTSINVTSNMLEVSNVTPALSFINVVINPTNVSNLGAILNAVEVYSANEFNSSYQTSVTDVGALAAIQESFNLTDWTGDPCLPIAWDWLQCSSPNTSTISRVLQIDLSDYNLTGSIPAAIQQLTELTNLQLQNNRLEGSIPVSLAALPNLGVLILDNNTFTGDVPPGLLTKTQDDSFNFSASGNPSLCFGGNGQCVKVPARLSSLSKGFGDRRRSRLAIGIIIGAAACGVVVLLLMAACLCFCCKSKTSSTELTATSDAEGLEPFSGLRDHSHLATPFSLMEVKAVTENFANVIGEGGFGIVYYGQLPDGEEVAVKVSTANVGSDEGTEDFLNEVALLSRVHHKNLVPLVGYCDELGQQILIYSYMSEGTLLQHLRGETEHATPLDWKTRLGIALDAARGLEFLHSSCSPPIVHRDVKSSNILLTSDLVAKVVDCGISKITTEDERTRGIATQIKGNNGYLDPEYFTSYQLTPKSDVYSFGIVLLEVVTGRMPNGTNIEGIPNSNLQNWVRESVRDGNIHAVVDAQMGGNYDVESIWKVVEMALVSLDQQSVKRPDMHQIVLGLTEALDIQIRHLQIPPTDHSPSQLATADYETYQRIHRAARSSRGSRSSNDSLATFSWRSNVTAR